MQSQRKTYSRTCIFCGAAQDPRINYCPTCISNIHQTNWCDGACGLLGQHEVQGPLCSSLCMNVEQPKLQKQESYALPDIDWSRMIKKPEKK